MVTPLLEIAREDDISTLGLLDDRLKSMHRFLVLLTALPLFVSCEKETRSPPAAVVSAQPTEVAHTTSEARPAEDPDSGTEIAGSTEEHPCKSKERVRITPLGPEPEQALQLDPDPGYGRALRSGTPDLDGREPEDLYILFPESFGSDGAQMQALYVGCGEGLFAPVWGPEYTLGLKVLDTRIHGWREVLRREKEEGVTRPSTTRYWMRFEQGQYHDHRKEAENR
jgi:hypothetical protein